MTDTGAGGRLTENLMHFARTLRAAGLPIGPGKVLDAVSAVEAVGIANRDDFYWTLHAVFVNRQDQKTLFDQAGVAKGSIPVIGWGNSLDTTQEVLQGYVNAAQWQDPQATSYMALSMAAMAASGVPPGFNVITGKLYEADAAKIYEKILSGK